MYFDGEQDRTYAKKRTEPLSAAFSSEGDDALRLRVCDAAWSIAPHGSARGTLDGASWDLRFERLAGELGEPRSILAARLRTGPFPKAKSFTPLPALTASGEIEVFGERIVVDGWQGMLGHNWGKEHPREHAWGQCFFPAAAGEPAAWVEGITGRITVLGGVTLPRLSTLIVQRGDESFRFDRGVDPWAQHAEIEERRWLVELKSARARVILEMDSSGRPIVCLGYKDPNGVMGYCINTKLARAKLVVEPTGSASFTLESDHGGALEFLRREPVRGLEVV